MSFFDHFTSLDAGKWTSVTANSGTVNATDSYLDCVMTAAADAAFVYYNTKLDKGVSQIWMTAVSQHTAFNNWPVQVLNKTTAPVAANFAPNTAAHLPVFRFVQRNNNTYEMQYLDSSSVIQRWNPATPGWQTGGVDSVGLEVANDYVILGFEFDADGGNSRFRMFIAHQTVASGYTADQGLRLMSLTDWVDWSAADTSTDGLWLCLGDIFTSAVGAAAGSLRFEWVRFANGTRQYAYTNAKDATAGNYEIRENWSYDGKFFVPRDRTTTFAPLTSTHGPAVVYDGSTYHMFYGGSGIRRATGTPGSTWTEQNTLISPPANHAFAFVCPIYTPWEPNGYVWQAIIDDLDTTGNTRVFRWITASTAGGTWTDRGVVLNVGAGGSDDEYGPCGATILHRNGQYEVWYTGSKPDGTSSILFQAGMLATGPTLGSLTKDGVGARLTAQNESESLTADLNGSTASLASTTGFEVDQIVYFKQDTNADNWSESRVRKVTTNTSIELQHRIMGFTTANSAKVFGFRAGNQQIRDIVPQADGSTFVYLTTYNFSRLDGTFYGVFQEECSLLIVPAGTDLRAMAPSQYSLVDCPIVFRGSWSNIRSNENVTMVRTMTPQSVRARVGFPMTQSVHRASFW